MNVRTYFGFLLLLLACAGMGHAQSGAQITLPQGNVTAGDSFDVLVKLDHPATCETGAFVEFVLPPSTSSFYAGTTIHAGETSVTLKATPARDLPGGTYQVQRGFLNPCPGYQNNKDFKVPAITVTVRALPDSNVYPTSADVKLSLTQKQFLDTKIAHLDNLDVELTTKIERNAADIPPLRDFLISIVKSADAQLTTTELQYREQIMKSQGPLPAFFADFHLQYQQLLVELRAPIPGNAQTDVRQSAMLLYVQLKKRTPTDQPASPPNFSGTYPPSVIAVRTTIRDNGSAYKYIRDNGRLTFDVQLSSFPSGARISYKKLIDDQYQDYSSPTDVANASFELATWNFKFHKEGCTDEPVLQIDPYEDSHPRVSVEFRRCRGR